MVPPDTDRMDFFGRMLTKAAHVLQLAPHPHLHARNARHILEFRNALELLERKLRYAHQHTAAAPAQTPVEVIDQIHSTLESNLEAIERLIPTAASAQVSDLAQHRTALAAETYKLEVLMLTLKNSGMISYDEALPAVAQRATKVANYTNYEIGRSGFRPIPETEKLMIKWQKLNSCEYLQNISEDSVRQLRSLGQIVHSFCCFLHLAKVVTCTPDDRWFYLAFCAKCLALARNSQDYTQIIHDGGLAALFIQDHITELEMELLAVFIEWPTHYQTHEWIARRTQTLNPEEARAELSNSDSNSTVSANIVEDRDLLTWSSNMGVNEPTLYFSLRLGSGGSLLLTPPQWVVALEPLRLCDLREAHIIPSYGTASQKSYQCDVIIKKKEPHSRESATVRLNFRHADQLRRFQTLVTGWVVKKDYGSGVPIRLRDKAALPKISLRKMSLKMNLLPDPVEYVGRLQLWDRFPEQSPEITGSNVTYALTGFTNTSQQTMSTNATIRAAQALPFAQILTVDGREAIINHRPPIPLLVLLRESPERDILALSVPPSQAAIDIELCQCKVRGSDCKRCFIRDVRLVDLQVGMHEFPKEKEAKSWVEVNLKSKEEREKFTADLGNRWDDYNLRLSQANTDSRHVNQGQFNTRAYQQS